MYVIYACCFFRSQFGPSTRCATSAGVVAIHRSMPPKGSKKAPSCLGAVHLHDNGWRVIATVGGRTVHGPLRLQKRDADADLAQARSAQTQEEYSSILTQMRESGQSSRGGAHSVATTVSEALPVAPTPRLSGNERGDASSSAGKSAASSAAKPAASSLEDSPSAKASNELSAGAAGSVSSAASSSAAKPAASSATLASEPSAIGVLPSNTSDDDVFGTGDDAAFSAMIDNHVKGEIARGNQDWISVCGTEFDSAGRKLS